MPEKKEGYLDENLSEKEKESGTRLPTPEEEGVGKGKLAEPQIQSPTPPDEFGDGDRS